MKCPKCNSEKIKKREGVVFDPFMGSGTTALAAVQLGRRYLGIEINPVYAEMARKRIKTMEDYLAGKSIHFEDSFPQET